MNPMKQSTDSTLVRVPARRPRKGEVMVTGVGLQIPDALDFGVWEQVGHRIVHVANSSAWCLGDWLVYGQHRYTERYRQVVAAVNLDYQTLRNYAWVARRFELARRRPEVSFQHHAEVAAAAPADQDRWLDLAVAGRWSRNELRRNIRAGRGEQVGNGAGAGAGTVHAGSQAPRRPAPASSEPVALELARLASADRIARWRDAARQDGRALPEWIVTTLDQGATQLLE